MSLHAAPIVHPRFEVIRWIGEGAYGTVLEAYDRERGERVALKRLHRTAPRALSAFKREFRLLCRLDHPGLPRLHELWVFEGETFFSMELIEGDDLRAHVLRPHVDAVISETRSRTSLRGSPRIVPERPLHLAGREATLRVREVIEALATVLGFVHRQGLVHCDVKPSNVRIGAAGRVVLLDFGLARSLHDASRGFAGTLAYAAPEQFGGAVDPAIDLYALGSLAYELLVGTPPFGGGASAAENKQRHDAAPLPLRPEDDDLVALVGGLLSRSPAERVLALDRWRGGDVAYERRARIRFVGRHDVLAHIDAAFDAALGGRATVLAIDGTSGIGKTALLAEAERRITARCPTATILRGRAAEGEHVPWNLFDGIAEGLAARRPAIGPVSALGEAFPELRTGACRAPRSVSISADLRAALSSLGPVVLLLDDAHWADSDSRRLLGEVLAAPAPPLLMILARRPGYPPFELRADVETIALGPLSVDDARALLAERGADADALARESRGHPLFVEELLSAHREASTRSLDDVLHARIERLPRPSRRVFDAIVLATEPMSSRALAEVVDEELATTTQILDLLHAGRFVRRADGPSHVRYAPYHDRLARIARRLLSSSEQVRIHAAFVRSLERTGGPAEAMCHHLQGSGRGEDAARFAVLAADRARDARAFEREAWFCGEALRLAPRPEADRHALRLRRAQAFRRARMSLVAANELLAVAAHERDDARSLRIAAARLYVAAGKLAQGRAILTSLLAEWGDSFPRSYPEAVLALLRERAWLAVELAVPFPVQRRFEPDRLAALRALAEGLGMIDTLRAAAFQTRAVRCALASPDPAVRAELLAIEAIFRGNAHRAGRRASRELLGRALAPFRGDVPARVAGFADAVHAMNERTQRPCRANLERFKRVESFFESLGDGDAWVVWSLRLSRSRGARILGDLNEMRAFYYAALAEADAQEDAYAQVTLRRSHALLHLADDEPSKARRQIEQTRWEGEPGKYHIQDWLALEARLEVDLYEGRAIELPRAQWRRLWSSPLHHGDTQRSVHLYMRGRLLLARPRSRLEDLYVRVELVRTAKRLVGQREGYAVAMARALFAGLAEREGRRRDAVHHLRRVVRLAARYELASLGANAALVLACLGEHVEPSRFHDDHGVRRPAAWASIDFPSFRTRLVQSESVKPPSSA